MEIIDLARKFSADPGSCSDTEVATLATDFTLKHPQIEALLAIANNFPLGKAEGMLAAIRRVNFERQHWDKLVKNPFASEAEITAMSQPSPLADLSQSELGKMIFGA